IPADALRDPMRTLAEWRERDIVVCKPAARSFRLRTVLDRLAWRAFGVGIAAQHLHFPCNDVRCVAFDAFLIGVLVRADAALDVNLLAFLEVFAGNLRELPEELHAMPFGATLLLSGLLVLPRFGRGDLDRAHRRARCAVARFRVRAQIADQDDLVDAVHALASFGSLVLITSRSWVVNHPPFVGASHKSICAACGIPAHVSATV